jgi:hypothetical protein
MIGVYLAGGISGGHLNPAVSLTLSLFRGFPFRKALIYITAQVLGGFLAGLIAYGIYRPAILAFNASGGEIAASGGNNVAVDLFDGGSGRAFYTSPAPFAGPGSSFGNEFWLQQFFLVPSLPLEMIQTLRQVPVCTHSSSGWLWLSSQWRLATQRERASTLPEILVRELQRLLSVMVHAFLLIEMSGGYTVLGGRPLQVA